MTNEEAGTARALERVLAVLGPDREKAGEAYETRRLRLITFFEMRGATCAAELADRTIERVGSKLADGQSIVDPPTYFLAFARNILKEHWAERKRMETACRALARLQPGESEEAGRELERESGCLDRCLAALPPETRSMLLRYYQSPRHKDLENRRAFAAELGIPYDTLRVRVHRHRVRLEKCVRECLARCEAEAQGRSESV